MPIFVQWKWNEDTLTFLVVFHFFDDYIKTNIRFTKKRLEGGKDRNAYLYYPIDHGIVSDRPVQFKSVMTWAPSHPELALLTELLSYANIINGMREDKKRKLAKVLQIPVFGLALARIEAGSSAIEYSKKGRFYLIGYEHAKPRDKLLCCAELCSEYIEYIKDLLKQYPKWT